MASGPVSRIVNGQVMHWRRHPVENRFVYPVFYLLLNCDELDGLNGWLFGVNRWRPLAFKFADHGDGRDPRVWVRAQLAFRGIRDCNDSLWVQTFPRVFGLVFNPVSFWYCGRPDGTVGAIIAEVNNTFGERHLYVLSPDPKSGRFDEVQAPKQFFVSPFYPVSGSYRFSFNTDLDAPHVRIDYHDDGRLQLNTLVWGQSAPLATRTLLPALIRQPFLTLGVVLRIHWQALRLWLKGVSLSQRVSSSSEEVSR